MNFSKSKYCAYWQCPLMAWLKKYKPEEEKIDDAVLERMRAGNEVGDLAMGLFGDFVETTEYTNGKINLTKMIENTKRYMAEGRDVICEASFDYNGLYCAVDILKKEKDGYAIYEVKSSTHGENYVYIVDISYQKYVLEKCGVKVTATYIVYIDNSYVRHGDIDIHKLFKITDLSTFVEEEMTRTEENLASAERLLLSDEEPDIGLSERCISPYKCAFFGYCGKNLPSPSVFDLYGLSYAKKIALYKSGVISFDDLKERTDEFTAKQKRQIEASFKNTKTYIDRNSLRKFMARIQKPTYFLDFESMQTALPQFENSKPYEQIVFQYSLHYFDENGELKHKEFLAESGVDPRRTVAEKLVEDIPTNASVIVYNKTFESGRIGELAKMFPDLAEKLLAIKGNIVDLMTPFRKGYCYTKEMGGSFSLKSVTPALFPDDPELDYHGLDGVHNGQEAKEIFPKIKDMPKEEQEIARKNLLAYCNVDTLATVKIYNKLVELLG